MIHIDLAAPSILTAKAVLWEKNACRKTQQMQYLSVDTPQNLYLAILGPSSEITWHPQKLSHGLESQYAT